MTTALTSSCGYAPARDVTGARGSFSVVAGASASDSALLVADAVLGARAVMAEEGVLAAGDGARLVVDVVRVDEVAAGLVARDGSPIARGSRLVLTGRARGGEPPIDTGDVTIVFDAASEGDAPRDALAHDQALRAAARRLGRRLAERALGLPSPANEAR